MSKSFVFKYNCRRSTRFHEVEWVGHKTPLLTVTFKRDLKQVTYSGVTQSAFESFVSADSMGRWYDDHIAGKYSTK